MVAHHIGRFQQWAQLLCVPGVVSQAGLDIAGAG